MAYSDMGLSAYQEIGRYLQDNQPSPNIGDTHLHATLQWIDELANNDVEMQASLSDQQTVLVLDTNILLHHFDVIQNFVSDSESLSVSILIIIPGVVIHELDGQKNRDGLAWLSRRASAWLLKKVKERRSVRGQAKEETCKASKNWKVRDSEEEFGTERANDYLIVDCAQYHQRAGLRVFLCSADRNLCFNCESAHISTISPSSNWSSRELAQAIFGSDIDWTKLGLSDTSYHPKGGKAIMTIDEDGMDVDDDNAVDHADHLPTHPLDLLHLQVIEHFTVLLIELVSRVAGPEVLRKPDGSGASASRYAPEWAKKHYVTWSASDCIDYLSTKKRLKPSSPRLGLFLTYPYGASGARRGQEWSRKDWDIAFESLKEIGDLWEENFIQESLTVLQPHFKLIFEEPMRPSGIGNTFG